MPDFLEEGEDWPGAGVFQMMDERLCGGSRKKTEEHGLKNELRRTEEEKLKLEFELASQDLRIEELEKEVNDLRVELEEMSKKFMYAATVAITLAAVHVCLLKPTL
ncbi:hypothetical protein BRADI_2g45835v3 [Brachypodium distachyon]|uniref:Uncharacterized protein n=1 Tax=Brachypodium distachyon TaxID=15368 RepID=A0A2K2DE72_BRADI|nr:hypothetical protein BRADI_2g45835v3 [Brachypodium distachyon]